jgi:DNA polymerase-1
MRPRLPGFETSVTLEGEGGPPVTVVTSSQEAAALRAALEGEAWLGLDLETTALDPLAGEVRLLAVATATHCFVVDLFRVDPRPIWPWLQERTLVIHNAVFDVAFLRRRGLEPTGRIIDTMVLDQLLRGEGQPRGLAELAAECLGLALDKSLQKSDWSGELSPAQLRYAGRDAWVARRVGEILWAQVQAQALEPVAVLEGRCIPVVAHLRLQGVPVAWARLEAARAAAAAAVETARARLGTLLGPVDPDSPKQVQGILRLRGIAVEKTDEASLAPYRDDPVVAALLQYRQAARRARLLSGVDFRPHPVTGRLHADWQLLGAPTGRMSCRRPNLQAVPRDPEIRACIRPPEGWVFVKIDFSQIELRIAAELSGDERLIRAFCAGEDVHRQTARLVLGREPTPEDRQLAKGLNFGLLYGAGPATLAASIRTAYGVDVSVAEAARLRAQFFAAYPGLRAWQEAQARGSGPLRTALGRLLRPQEPTDRLNYPIQATGADGLKLGLAQLWAGRPRGVPAWPVAVVHDEVLLEAPREMAAPVQAWAVAALTAGMQTLLRRVPVVAEARICRDWSGTPVEDDGHEEGDDGDAG